MKRVTFYVTLISLIFASTGFIKAQSTLNLENLRPEVELIIGLNHPKDSELMQLQLQDNDGENEDETDLPNTGIDGITLSDNDGDAEDDILEDYLEELEEQIGSEPDKEELVLERLKSTETDMVSLYPNPAVNFINVKIEDVSTYEVEVYDLIGNLVISEKSDNMLNTALKIDISNLQKGVYLMYIETSTKRTIKKFGVN